MILPILKYGNPLLRGICKNIEEITSLHVNLANDILNAMYASQGVGLAAPQIGKLLRLIVVDVDYPKGTKNPYILFNPEIVESSGTQENEEGCLSLPEISGYVNRAEKIKIKYVTKEGNEDILEADEYLSQCIQHEIDHLNGILYIDKLSRTDRMLLENKIKKIARGK